MKALHRRGMIKPAFIGCVLVLAGCSGSAETSTEATPAVTASQEEATAATADVALFCESVLDVEAELSTGPDVDFATSTPEEILEASRAFAREVSPLFDAVEDAAPAEVQDNVETLSRLTRQSLETGEDPFGDPAMTEADAALDDYMTANCGYPAIEVTAVDYAFEGLPETIEAQTTGFALTNGGGEVHELAVMRINDGVDQSIEELLELPEEEAETMVEFVGGVFAEPGEGDTAFLRLEPGRYAALCFLPVGSTSMEVLEQAEAAASEAPSAPAGDAPTAAASPAPGASEGQPQLGPPHFTQGMTAEFTVE